MSTNKTPTYEKNLYKRALIHGVTVGCLLFWMHISQYFHYFGLMGFFIFLGGGWATLAISNRLLFKHPKWHFNLALSFFIGLLCFISFTIGQALFFRSLMHNSLVNVSKEDYHIFIYQRIFLYNTILITLSLILIAEICLWVYRRYYKLK